MAKLFNAYVVINGVAELKGRDESHELGIMKDEWWRDFSTALDRMVADIQTLRSMQDKTKKLNDLQQLLTVLQQEAGHLRDSEDALAFKGSQFFNHEDNMSRLLFLIFAALLSIIMSADYNNTECYEDNLYSVK